MPPAAGSSPGSAAAAPSLPPAPVSRPANGCCSCTPIAGWRRAGRMRLRRFSPLPPPRTAPAIVQPGLPGAVLRRRTAAADCPAVRLMRRHLPWHLVVFARAPALGTGKRRLARDIGDLAALRFERGMLAQLLRRLGRDRRWRLRLA